MPRAHCCTYTVMYYKRSYIPSSELGFIDSVPAVAGPEAAAGVIYCMCTTVKAIGTSHMRLKSSSGYLQDTFPGAVPEAITE